MARPHEAAEAQHEVPLVDPAGRGVHATHREPLGAVRAERCVINDAPWLLRRMRPGVLHLASDAIEPREMIRVRLTREKPSPTRPRR